MYTYLCKGILPYQKHINTTCLEPTEMKRLRLHFEPQFNLWQSCWDWGIHGGLCQKTLSLKPLHRKFVNSALHPELLHPCDPKQVYVLRLRSSAYGLNDCERVKFRILYPKREASTARRFILSGYRAF